MHEPRPAGAELVDAGLLELGLEVGEGAEGRVDRVGERAGGLAAAVRAHALPEQRVVVVAAAVVAHGGPLVPGRLSRFCRTSSIGVSAQLGALERRVRPCRRRPGGACRGAPASWPRRRGARARRSRTAAAGLRRPCRVSFAGRDRMGSITRAAAHEAPRRAGRSARPSAARPRRAVARDAARPHQAPWIRSNAYGSSAAAIARDGRLGQRDEVRVAVHEADVGDVRDDLDDVAARAARHGRRRRPPSAARSRPRSGRRSGSASGRRRGRASRPSHSSIGGSGAHDPLRVVGVQEHRAVEAARPLDHRRSSSAGGRSRCRGARRASSISRRVASSSSGMQSHSTCRSPCGTSSARWPIANFGSVPMPVSPPSSRSPFVWPARSSVERRPRLPASGDVLARVLADRAAGGGASVSANWVPQVTQM